MPTSSPLSIACGGIIFDLDGVLVDSTAVVEKHWRRWAAVQGLDGDEVIATAHGRRTIDTIRVVAPNLDASDEAAKLEREEAPDTHGLRTFAGVGQLLRSLPPSRWAVATSGTTVTARTRLQFAKLPIPAVMVTAEDVIRGKPDPEAYLVAAARLGIPPKHCLVVEDAPAGITAARRAGMQVLAVPTTHPSSELAEATWVLSSIESLAVTWRDDELNVSARG